MNPSLSHPKLSQTTRRWRTTRTVYRILFAFLLFHVTAASSTTPLEVASGISTGVLSIWKANIVPSKEESFMVFYHVIQVMTVLSLITYIGSSTIRRTDTLRQVFVITSLICGAGLAALYPGRRFETCLEGFIALGFYLTGFVFDNIKTWWTTLWRLLDRLRPERRQALLPM